MFNLKITKIQTKPVKKSYEVRLVVLKTFYQFIVLIENFIVNIIIVFLWIWKPFDFTTTNQTFYGHIEQPITTNIFVYFLKQFIDIYIM